MAIECTKLCIRSSVVQAYRCLWHYKLQHVLIAFVATLPYCLAGLLGFLDPVLSVSSVGQDMPEGFNLSFALLVLTTFVWAIPVTILWHRLYLLGPEHLIRKKIWPLITRSLTVISNSLVFFGMGLIAAVAITWGILYLRVLDPSVEMTGTVTSLGQMEYNLYLAGMISVVSFLMLIALRLSMAFSSQAIGKSMGFVTSWRMTRKNTFRMLAATLIAALPLVGLNALLLWGANRYFQIDLLAGTGPDPDIIYIFVLTFSPFLTLPLAILCSLTSSFYRHCGCAEFREST